MSLESIQEYLPFLIPLVIAEFALAMTSTYSCVKASELSIWK